VNKFKEMSEKMLQIILCTHRIIRVIIILGNKEQQNI